MVDPALTTWIVSTTLTDSSAHINLFLSETKPAEVSTTWAVGLSSLPPGTGPSNLRDGPGLDHQHLSHFCMPQCLTSSPMWLLSRSPRMACCHEPSHQQHYCVLPQFENCFQSMHLDMTEHGTRSWKQLSDFQLLVNPSWAALSWPCGEYRVLWTWPWQWSHPSKRWPHCPGHVVAAVLWLEGNITHSV